MPKPRRPLRGQGEPSRRRFLVAIGATSATALAGCQGDGGGTESVPDGGGSGAGASPEGGDGDGDGDGSGGRGDGDGDGGTEVDPPSEDDETVVLEDGGRYYVGQQLSRESGVSADETLDLVKPDGSEALVFADSDGKVQLDTADLPPGRLKLRSASVTVVFDLVEQEFRTFAFGQGSVPTDGDPATLSIQSNRRSYEHYLTATLDGDAVAAAALQPALGGQGTRWDTDEDGTDETVEIEGTNSQTLDVDVSTLSAGEFALSTDVPDTTAEATARLSIEPAASSSGSASLATRTVSAQQGTVMDIPVTLTNTASARMTLGSRDLNYLVTLDVHDVDGDGRVTVRWDTGVAGQTGDESGAFSAAGGSDEVRNVTRSTGQLPGPIAAESYSISLSVGGTETGLGLATVTLPETTTTEEPDEACTPGHTAGDPACQQVADDSEVLTTLDTAGTPFPVVPAYPCGWETAIDDLSDAVQLSVSRRDIGGADGSVATVQVRAEKHPVKEGFIEHERGQGEYVDITVPYGQKERTGIVSAPSTAQYGTLAHVVIPFQDALVHLEFASTLKGIDCDIEPRPDYDLVRAMLRGIQPNPDTTFADASDHF